MLNRHEFYRRALWLTVAVIHLLAGLSYGHARMAPDGDASPVLQVYATHSDAQDACHTEAQKTASVAADAECLSECLGCCAHVSCCIPVVVSTLGTPVSSPKPVALERALKEFHPPTEPRPPRSLRYSA